MNDLEKALLGICSLLESLDIPFMIIGGLATSVWAQPRATLDVDVTVWFEDHEIGSAPGLFSPRFRILVENPAEFISETRVLPLESAEGVRVDVIFAMLPFEREAIRRAVRQQVGDQNIPFCSPEDLIIYKISSDRDKDRMDVRAVVTHRRKTLDRAYLDPRIKELADILEKQDIWDLYLKLMEESSS